MEPSCHGLLFLILPEKLNNVASFLKKSSKNGSSTTSLFRNNLVLLYVELTYYHSNQHDVAIDRLRLST